MLYDKETKITRRDLAKMLGIHQQRINELSITPGCKFPKKVLTLPHNESAYDLTQVMSWLGSNDLKEMLELTNQHKQRHKLKERAKEKVEKAGSGKIGLDNKLALSFLTRGRF